MLTYFRLYANCFVLKADVYPYNTMASTYGPTDLHFLGPRSNYGQRCIRHKGSVYGIDYLLRVRVYMGTVPVRVKLYIYFCFKHNIKKYLRTQ